MSVWPFELVLFMQLEETIRPRRKVIRRQEDLMLDDIVVVRILISLTVFGFTLLCGWNRSISGPINRQNLLSRSYTSQLNMNLMMNFIWTTFGLW